MGVIELLKQNVFYPSIDGADALPNKRGLYLICVKNIKVLPSIFHTLTLPFFEDSYIIYLGIAGSRGLRDRDYKNHFQGTARNSTLRKSFGVLFGYDKIQRQSEKGTTKYRFIPEQEKQLTEWMKNNLFMRYCNIDGDLETIETELIKHFNPPLNLSKNANSVNLEFRKQLSKLRCDI